MTEFLDRTVTAILAFEGNAKIVAHAGGYSDYLARKLETATHQSGGARGSKSAKKSAVPDKPKPNRAPRLSFKDQHILDSMPALIANLEKQIATVETALAAPDLFATDPAKFNKLADQLAAMQTDKAEKEDAWLTAAEKAEAIAEAETP